MTIATCPDTYGTPAKPGVPARQPGKTGDLYNAFVVNENGDVRNGERTDHSADTVRREDNEERLLFPYYAVDTARTHIEHLGGTLYQAAMTVGEAEQLLNATCPYPRR